MDRLRIGIVGGGPAGAYAAWQAARLGHAVTFFDHRAPWEKPCGGGITVKAQEEFPWIGEIAPLGRAVREFRFLSPEDRAVEFRTPRETLIFARSTFDEEVRKRARAAGAVGVGRKVQSIERDGGGWRLTAQGESRTFDFLIGADGAVSRVREILAPDFPGFRNSIASGFFIPARLNRIETKFFKDSRGYLWFFPRPDHLSVGLCLWGGEGESALGRETRARLLALLGDHFPGLDPETGKGYGAYIPTIMDPGCWQVDRSGPGWALVGDAGGFVDAITGEGIFYALRSARAWGRALELGDPAGYDAIWRAEFGAELAKASALVRRFYEPRFIERVVRFGARSATIRAVLADLVMGTQPYRSLRRRLQREIVRAGWRRAMGWMSPRYERSRT
ncbi:MAG: NAD(P)/FAD-dependent oxidoreductase [Gemmatimonadetes bacterium]|nr:NAD(P)/FAD-dependent oxidoreductase [Gemmatimonadota bacterium]